MKGAVPALLLLAATAAARPLGVPPASVAITDRYGSPLSVGKSQEGLYCIPVRLESVSPWVVLATLAAEDKRFLVHDGVDVQAVFRAALQNARAGRIVSGGSTITQQLARTLEPRPRTLVGKVLEMRKAWKLEKSHGKREILEAYLNDIYYGCSARGIEAASQGYFGMSCGDLSLAQAALVCGIPKSPNRYNPFRNRREAVARQRRILDRLREWKWIDGPTWRLARGEVLSFRGRAPADPAPHFCRMLRSTFPGRRRMTTTIDLRLQQYAADVLASEVAAIREDNVNNGAVVVIDNATGDILAWVGSAAFMDEGISGQVDCVTALRQPGSSLKPFLYTLGFQDGLRASDMVRDEPMFAEDGYSPRNYDERFHGRVSAREALACSFNIPAVRLANEVGLDRYYGVLKGLGFESLENEAGYYGLGLALGNGEVTLLELANAYASLARGGTWKPVRFVDGEDGGGEQDRSVVSPQAAYLVTDVLTDNSARVESFGWDSPFNVGFPLAGKTGTTKDYRDNWAVGYTPRWTVAVWVGNCDGEPMRRVSGISGAAPILRDVALKAFALYGAEAFPEPPGMARATICPESGLLAGPDCPRSLSDLYMPGSAPTMACMLREHAQMASSSGERSRIEHPRPRDVYVIDPGTAEGAQVLCLRSNLGGTGNHIRWEVDSEQVKPEDGRAWWPLSEGVHVADLLVEKEGKFVREDSVKFLVVR